MHSILSKTSYVFHVTRTCQIGVCVCELNQGNRGFANFRRFCFWGPFFSVCLSVSLFHFLSLSFSFFPSISLCFYSYVSLCLTVFLSVCLSVCLLSFLSNVVASEIATTRRRFLVVATFSASRREREERPSWRVVHRLPPGLFCYFWFYFILHSFGKLIFRAHTGST